MSPPVQQIPSDTEIPDSVDVAIIGGGIIGVSTAYFLARSGVSVAIFEKGVIAGEQSSRNWGFCRQQGRDAAEIPLIKQAMKIWRNLEQDIEADVGFSQTGIVYLAADEKAVDGYEQWLNHAHKYDLDSHMITADQIADLYPGMSKRWPAALYTPSDGRAEPEKAAPVIAEAARKLGATIHQSCAVRGIETSTGRIASIVTEQGRIKTSNIVLAGGAWSRLFCRSLGIDLPQLSVRSSVMRTEPLPDLGEAALWGPGFAFRKRQNGGYTIAHGGISVAEIVPDSFRLMFRFLPALQHERQRMKFRLNQRFFEQLVTPKKWPLDTPTTFEKQRILDPAADLKTLNQALQTLGDHLPAFKQAEIAQSWAGYIDVTPDVLPVISEVEQLPGFFLATGFSGHGFGIGPGAGQLMAEIVQGKTTCVDPTPFRYSRYFDGTKISISTGL